MKKHTKNSKHLDLRAHPRDLRNGKFITRAEAERRVREIVKRLNAV